MSWTDQAGLKMAAIIVYSNHKNYLFSVLVIYAVISRNSGNFPCIIELEMCLKNVSILWLSIYSLNEKKFHWTELLEKIYIFTDPLLFIECNSA